MSEQNVNQEYVGKDVKVSDGLYGNLDRTSEDYKFFRTKNYSAMENLAKLSYNYTDKNNNETIARVGQELNIANLKSYFILDRDNNISKFKEGGSEFAKTTSNTFKQYKDYLGTVNSTDELYVMYKGDANKLLKHYDKGNLDGDIANRFKQFAVPVTNGAVLGETGDFSNILRKESNIIIVPTGNTIDFNNTIKGTSKFISEGQRKDIGKIYTNVLIQMSTNIVDGKPQVNIQELKNLNNNLQNLEYGKINQTLAAVNNNFLAELINNNIITKEEAKENLLFNTTYEKNEKFKNKIDKLGNVTPDNTSIGSTNTKSISTITLDNGRVVPLTEKNIQYFNEIGFDYKKIPVNNPAVTNSEKKVTQTTGDGSVAENIYGVNKNISTKIEPSELGDTTFKNLESVLKILPKPMTGQEIKDNYKIDFPINLKSTFVPLK
jgi:hypothetical protein